MNIKFIEFIEVQTVRPFSGINPIRPAVNFKIIDQGFFLDNEITILKNIMFLHRWEVSVRINLPLFSPVVPASIFMFLSCRPFVAITTLSTGLVGVEVTSVSWLGQLTVGV